VLPFATWRTFRTNLTKVGWIELSVGDPLRSLIRSIRTTQRYVWEVRDLVAAALPRASYVKRLSLCRMFEQQALRRQSG
jgi:hypothetical protein